MAEKTTRKAIYYFRATFDGKPVDLDTLVRQLRRKRPSVAASEWNFANGATIRIQHFKRIGPTGTLVHFVQYFKGEHAPTITSRANVEEDDEGSQAAPAGKDFKQSDFYMLVSRHNVVFISNGISHQRIANYLQLQFRDANFDRNSSRFNLTPATNIDKLNFIRRHGVKEVELNSNAYALSFPKKLRDGWLKRVIGGIVDEIEAIASKDQSIAQQKALEDLVVNLTVRLDGNTRAAQETHKLIEDIAETVIDDDAPIEGFTIVTSRGERVTPSDVRLHKSVSFTRRENGLDHSLVWGELKSYLRDLEAGNITER